MRLTLYAKILSCGARCNNGYRANDSIRVAISGCTSIAFSSAYPARGQGRDGTCGSTNDALNYAKDNAICLVSFHTIAVAQCICAVYSADSSITQYVSRS